MLLKLIKKQPRHLPQSSFSSSSSSSSHIAQQVPREILDKIVEELSSLEQVCLALTCKSLYIYFLSLHKIQQNNTPGSLQIFLSSPRKKRPILCRDSEVAEKETENPREQLLRRLEDDSRWKFCRGCWILHRHEAWNPPPPRFSWAGFSSKMKMMVVKREKTKCKPSAGMIDICPCWSIPAHGRRELAKAIVRIKKEDVVSKEYYHDELLYYPAQFPVSGLYPRGSYVGHDCVFEDHPFATLRISSIMFWHRFHRTLQQGSQCTFSISLKALQLAQEEEEGKHLDIKAPWMCPHENTKAWLRQFFKEAGSDFGGWQRLEDQIEWGGYYESCRCSEELRKDVSQTDTYWVMYSQSVL